MQEWRGFDYYGMSRRMAGESAGVGWCGCTVRLALGQSQKLMGVVGREPISAGVSAGVGPGLSQGGEARCTVHTLGR
jgi:hypothetical protein